MSNSPYRFHPDADREFGEAAAWYEERAGLAAEFIAAVRAKIEEITLAPRRWRLLRGVRRAFVGRFPYSIVYRETSDGYIEILAVAHFKRRPGYWSRR